MQVRPAITSNARFHRDAWLEINLDHLESNLQTIYQQAKKPLILVLKADAYGHGAGVIANMLDSYSMVHAYAVANIDEAINLRQSTEKKIIVLGITPEWSYNVAIEKNIELTIADEKSAEKLNRIAFDLSKVAKIHLKLDTGMNRIGFKVEKPEDFREIIRRVDMLFNLKIQSIFSHYSASEDAQLCAIQTTRFINATENINFPRHIASSKAARLINQDPFDYVRVGIELFGLDNPILKPVMSLLARVVFIKQIGLGEAVSYNGTWSTKRTTKIVTLPLGYADGIPRALSNRIKAYVNESFIPQVGLITMDQIMFDIGDTEDIKVGDQVELIGPHLPLKEWAKLLNTISYELVTSLNLRLPKVYTRDL